MHQLASKCKNVLETDALTSIADKGYISTTDVANCVADGITANVCMDEDSLDFCIETDEDCAKPTSHTNGRIVYLKNRNICVCPMGEILYPGSHRKSRNTARYYNTKVCARCAQKCATTRFASGEVKVERVRVQQRI